MAKAELSEALQNELEALEKIEHKRRLYDEGLTEEGLRLHELGSKVLLFQMASATFQRIYATLQSLDEDDQRPLEERLEDLRDAVELKIEIPLSIEEINQVVIDSSSAITASLEEIKDSISDLTARFDEEIAKNDEQRELEKNTLEAINKYLRTH